MTKLRIADDFALPPEAVTETFALLAKRGVGKTYTASVLAEELLKAGLQVVIVDPIGVWWGLRASADGTRVGLPIVVLGGDHGDLPLDAGAGAIVADLVVEERLSVVLDLSLQRKGESTRFMEAFAERLYHRNRTPLHLILDEADAFAPQRPMPGQQRLLGAIEDLVRRGRARGIGVTLVTQRAAVLNKDVLTQAEVLITLRTIAPQDRDAIDAWVKVHGTPEQRAELMASLPSLPVGTAWFWSPGWLDVFQRVQVRRRETFDSSATPKAGAKREAPRKLADVDLAALRERLAATIERAAADDPKLLRRRIAELEQQLRAQPSAEPEVVAYPVFQEGEAAAMERASAELRALVRTLDGLTSSMDAKVRLAIANLYHPDPERPGTYVHGKSDVSWPTESLRPAPAPPLNKPTKSRREAEPPPPVKDTDELPAPQQRILDALATFEAAGLSTVARSNVAVFADQSPRSSGFTNNLGRLRTLGLVDYPTGGQVSLTDAGRREANASWPMRDVADLHAAWFGKLTKPQARILAVLIDHYPNAVDKAELARAAEQSPTSSGYSNNLGALRSLGLIEYPSGGQAAATDLLFPDLSPARRGRTTVPV